MEHSTPPRWCRGRSYQYVESPPEIAFNARRAPFASARTRRAAAYALSHSTLAPVWNLVPSTSLLPPGIGTARQVKLAPPPRPLSPATAVMAVPPGCEACERAYPLARAALARVAITLRRRAANLSAVIRRPQAFDLLLTSTTLEYPDPASFLDRILTVAMPSAHGWPTPPSSPSTGSDGFSATPATAPRPSLLPGSPNTMHPSSPWATRQSGSFSARLCCRISPRFGVDLAALCLRELRRNP
jgi:hypothetical protein